MAITDIQATVLKITGATPTANSVEDAQRFIVSSIPKELLKWAMAYYPVSADGSAIAVENDSVVEVTRTGYSCREIPFSESIWANNSGSLKKATASFPVYWIQDDGVKIAPATDGSNSGYVYYISFAEVDDDCDLRNAVIFYTASQEFEEKVFESFTTTAPTYIAPVISITTHPTVTWSFPTSPIAPSISAQLVADFSSAVPSYVSPVFAFDAVYSPPSIVDFAVTSTPPVAPSLSASVVDESGVTSPVFTPPVMTALDWSDADYWIDTEEDPEMLTARISDITARIGEYSAKLQEAQAEFNEDSAEYQGKLQVVIQNAQLESAELGQELQNHASLVGLYTSDVNREVQEYTLSFQKDIQLWQAERQTALQKYSMDMQSAVNSFNRDQAEYQGTIQEAIQEAQLADSNESKKIQKFQAETGNYQAEVNKIVAENQGQLGEWQQRNALEVQRLGADMQNALNDFNEKNTEYQAQLQIKLQNSQIYSKEADKYYQWAHNEIKNYIQNNSKMINQTIAAQAQSEQQQQRR